MLVGLMVVCACASMNCRRDLLGGQEGWDILEGLTEKKDRG